MPEIRDVTPIGFAREEMLRAMCLDNRTTLRAEAEARGWSRFRGTDRIPAWMADEIEREFTHPTDRGGD